MSSVLRGEDGFDSKNVLGTGSQAWVDVTNQRAFDTVYINDTDKPIIVQIHIQNNGQPGSRPIQIAVTANNSFVINQVNDLVDFAVCQIVVTQGESYQLVKSVNNNNIFSWREYR